MDLNKYIVSVKDFPKKGILFRDISPLLDNPKAFKTACLKMIAPFASEENILWAGIDARGFIFSSYIAALRGEGMILVRKSGKLPPPCLSQSYSLEYGDSSLSIKPTDSKRKIVLIDDVLATGGTLKAAEIVCNKANYNVLGASVLIDLKDLNSVGYKIASSSVYSVLEY